MCPPQSPTLPLTFLKAPHKHPHSAPHFPRGPSQTPPLCPSLSCRPLTSTPALPLTFLQAPYKHPHSAHFPAGPSKTPPSTDHLHEVQIPMGTRPKTLPPTHWLGLRCQTTSSTTPHGNHRSHTHTSLVLLWFVFYEGEKLLPTANPQLL